MRIYSDGFVFENDRQRGIQRYHRELLSRVGMLDDVQLVLAWPAVATLPDNCSVSVLPTARGRGPLAGLLARAPVVSSEARRARLCAASDLFHSTFYTRPPAEGPVEVVTVHDMIVERFPDLFNPALVDAAVAEKREAIASAARCIAVSHATAEDLAAIYPEHASKIRVVHHGVDHLAHAHGGESRLPDPPFSLYVGDRSGYKNFRCAAEAAACRGWPRSTPLVVVGPPFGDGETLMLRRLGLEERVIHLGRVADADLGSLYRSASVIVVPSLCEGFGFALLEAQALGAPLACSDIPVFRELVGEAAEFFDPRIAESLAGAVRRAVDPARAAQLRAAGAANASRYTWSRCASETREVYAEALGLSTGAAPAPRAKEAA